MLLNDVAEARASGARLSACAKVVELDPRTMQRWKQPGGERDKRQGPKTRPRNALTDEEKEEVLRVVNGPEYRDLSPKQIVPKLADSGEYLASESTIYRLLKKERLDSHRGRARPRRSVRPEELIATGPNQVWSWDITYLRSPIQGVFFYLYLLVDVWSRKVVGWCVHDRECGELASELVRSSIALEGADPHLLALHQDNGGPMKGATLKATLEALGVMPSYSRPRVSDDNPFSESLFRTLKYRPDYPHKPFESLKSARKWVADFVAWYNGEHLHSGIGFVTPSARHEGAHERILKDRRKVYEAAKRRKPQRWSGATRSWRSDAVVILNPAKTTNTSNIKAAQAA